MQYQNHGLNYYYFVLFSDRKNFNDSSIHKSNTSTVVSSLMCQLLQKLIFDSRYTTHVVLFTRLELFIPSIFFACEQNIISITKYLISRAVWISINGHASTDGARVCERRWPPPIQRKLHIYPSKFHVKQQKIVFGPLFQ